MAKIEELESELVLNDSDFIEEGGDDELAIANDVIAALSLLKKSMHLLDYMGDSDLCKTITKRERETMSRVSDSIREFLDDVGSHYEDEEDE